MAGRASGEPLAGRWYGEVAREGHPIHVIVDIRPEAAGLTAFLSAPYEAVHNSRIGPVKVDEGGVISFFMDPGSAQFGFTGTLEGGRLEGRMQQAEFLFEVRLSRREPGEIGSAPDPTGARERFDPGTDISW